MYTKNLFSFLLILVLFLNLGCGSKSEADTQKVDSSSESVSGDTGSQEMSIEDYASRSVQIACQILALNSLINSGDAEAIEQADALTKENFALKADFESKFPDIQDHDLFVDLFTKGITSCSQ